MKKQRGTIEINLIGWGLMLGGSLCLFLPFLHFRQLLDSLFSAYPPPLKLVWAISSAILIGFIIGGSQVLKLQEVGRSLVVFLAIIDTPHLIVGKAIYNHSMMQPMYIRNFFLIPFSIMINFIIIYSLSHPRLKRHFKSS